jgi:hypothetical protein
VKVIAGALLIVNDRPMNLSGNAEGRAAVATQRSANNPRDCEGVEQWIAGVLQRARQAAEAEATDELRGILYVAHCFADELATATPRFDRLSFIRAVTDGPS